MNLPNKLTTSRFVLTAIFAGVMSSHSRWANCIGLALFALASATDWLDGHLARKHNLVTDFGKLMDPLADKILTAAAFICLVPEHGLLEGRGLPAWVAIVIIAREFSITGLRLLAASKGVVLAAEKIGKHKTAWQMITILYFLTLLSLAELERAGLIGGLFWWAAAWKWGGRALLTVALGLTVWSGTAYLWRHRDLITTR